MICPDLPNQKAIRLLHSYYCRGRQIVSLSFFKCLLKCCILLWFAPICRAYPERLFCPKLCHQNPKRSKIRQIDAVNRSKNVVGIGGVTTVRLILVFLLCPINRNFSSSKNWGLFVCLHIFSFNFINRFTTNTKIFIR